MARKTTADKATRHRRIVSHSVEDDVRSELDFHLEQRTAELLAVGWSPSEAANEAQRRFGSRPSIEQQCRDQESRRRNSQRRSHMFDVLRQDFTFTLRQLIGKPAFTIAALITLTLGIGAVSTMYTLIQGVLLQPLPYPQSNRIVNLWEHTATGHDIRVSRPNFDDWAAQHRSFDGFAFYSGWQAEEPVVTTNGAVSAQTARVSRDFFRVLGVPPLTGRVFLEEEASVGGPATVVVSETFWRDSLGAVENLDGVTALFAGERYAVIGVMPSFFDFPAKTQLWSPVERTEDSSARSAHNWSVVARLAENATMQSARVEMNTIAQRIKTQHGDDASSSEVTITSIKSELVGPSRKPLLFLFGASALVLLLAATNLASGLLARAIDRQEEIALRSALGAGASRLVRQLLTESIFLTLLGGLLGTGFAFAALEFLRRINTTLPRLQDLQVDLPVILVTLAISALTGLIFGLIPALKATQVDLRSTLTSSRSGDGSRQRLWTTMVASEVALALVLLVGSIMLATELWNLLDRSAGFDTEEIATLDLAVPGLAPPASESLEDYALLEAEVATFHARFAGELTALPGVASVALTRELPLRGSHTNGRICLAPKDCQDDKDLQGYAGYRLTSPGYFSVMGIPVLSGRDFSDNDSADGAFVAVVNRAFADRYFPNGNALDQQILSGGMDLHGTTPTRIVGIVGDVLHNGLDKAPPREIYYPAAQRALRTRSSTYVVQSESGNLEALLGTLRGFLTTNYPDLPPEVLTLETIRVNSLSDRRFALVVLSSLALVALGLALTGIWAVISYRVAQRRQEIGIRVALGLSQGGVLRLVLGDSARLLGLGIGVGSLLAFIAARTLRSQIGGLDGGVAVFVAAAVLLMLTGLAASWLPAQRARTIEPNLAMRGSTSSS